MKGGLKFGERKPRCRGGGYTLEPTVVAFSLETLETLSFQEIIRKFIEWGCHVIS